MTVFKFRDVGNSFELCFFFDHSELGFEFFILLFFVIFYFFEFLDFVPLSFDEPFEFAYFLIFFIGDLAEADLIIFEFLVIEGFHLEGLEEVGGDIFGRGIFLFHF